MTTKTIAAFAALILTALTVTKAEAKQTNAVQFDRHAVSGGYYYGVQVAGIKQMRRKKQKRVRAHASPARQIARHRFHKHAKSASLEHVTPKLAAKAREIMNACGNAKVISAYRPGARVRGYGTRSLHSRYPAEAIDMTGDTSCIYPRLKGWPGGFSIDYAAVRHIHISLASDRRERGARFAHYGTRRYARAR